MRRDHILSPLPQKPVSYLLQTARRRRLSLNSLERPSLEHLPDSSAQHSRAQLASASTQHQRHAFAAPPDRIMADHRPVLSSIKLQPLSHNTAAATTSPQSKLQMSLSESINSSLQRVQSIVMKRKDDDYSERRVLEAYERCHTRRTLQYRFSVLINETFVGTRPCS